MDWVREQLGKLWTWIAQGVAWGTVVIGKLSLSDWTMIIGMAVSAVVGAYTIYTRRQHLKIAEQVAAQKGAFCINCPKVQGDE